MSLGEVLKYKVGTGIRTYRNSPPTVKGRRKRKNPVTEAELRKLEVYLSQFSESDIVYPRLTANETGLTEGQVEYAFHRFNLDGRLSSRKTHPLSLGSKAHPVYVVLKSFK